MTIGSGQGRGWPSSFNFVASFPILYRLDEDMSQPRWSLSRCAIEASAVGAISLLLIDLWTSWFGPIA